MPPQKVSRKNDKEFHILLQDPVTFTWLVGKAQGGENITNGKTPIGGCCAGSVPLKMRNVESCLPRSGNLPKRSFPLHQPTDKPCLNPGALLQVPPMLLGQHWTLETLPGEWHFSFVFIDFPISVKLCLSVFFFGAVDVLWLEMLNSTPIIIYLLQLKKNPNEKIDPQRLHKR